MPQGTALTPRRPSARRRSILSRMLLPVFAVMLLQSLLYIALLWQGGVITHADENAYAILEERVAGRVQYLENEMLNKWGNLRETELTVLTEIAHALDEWGVDASAIATDAELNARLVERLVPDLIYLLRRNMVSGAFLVLDGPGIKNDALGVSRAGFYLRDLDPTTYSQENADLLVERGLPDVSKKLGLALDAGWQPTFEFMNPDDPGARYYFAPLTAAQAHDARSSTHYGYWSTMHRQDPADVRVISYSIPLVMADGSIIGVLGVDITESLLVEMLGSEELLPSRAGAYVLAVTTDGEHYERVLSNGRLYRIALKSPEVISLGDAVRESTRRVVGLEGGEGEILACVDPLALYATNTPFDGESWTLLALVEQDALLSFSKEIMLKAIGITALALVLGLLCVFVASRVVTSPITALVADLKTLNPHEPVALSKLNIKEIDELTDSIEGLSASVAASSSKISTILSMTKAMIGVFEYGEADELVYVSSNLGEVLGLEEQLNCEHNFVPRAQFTEVLGRLQTMLDDEREHLYKLETPKGPRWIKLTIINENGKTLGAASDVTRDIAAKKQIEYERDYDILTNLFNRRAFHQQLSELFNSGRDLGASALIMWDLDNLKYVNDTYGHECGDRYIVALADCLTYYSTVANAISARRSGDEFYTFIYGFGSIDAARRVIEAGWANLSAQPFILPGGIDYHINVSAGIAWYRRDAETWQELLRYADYAMYNVKHTVKGSMNEFDKASYLKDASMLYGMEALGKLIDYSLVKFAFQPILSVESGEVFGYELLMRPQVEEFKSPLDVLRIAQSQAKLYHIERITWFGAMEAFVERAEQNVITQNQRAFINSIGSQMLSDADLKRFEAQFAPYLSRIVLELLESERSVDDYVTKKIEIMKAWQAMIAIDDYGTGYNSEASLVFLSPNMVKLDMALVRDVDKDVNRQDLLRSLIAYANARGIEVLAEGVETEEEMRTLVMFGVNYLQGYYVARPSFEIVPIDEGVLKSVRDAHAIFADARKQPREGDAIS